MKRIHFDMSATLDHTEPAGATRRSTLRSERRARCRSTSACGDATFDLPLMPATSGSLSLMPSGAKMRVRMNSSHGMPDTPLRSTAPAMAYMTFW